MVASQGVSITATQNEVKSLSQEIKQIKAMLLDVGQMMKDMQRKRCSSSSTSSECSSNQASPVPILIKSKQQDDLNTRDSIVDELSECIQQHQNKQENVPSTHQRLVDKILCLHLSMCHLLPQCLLPQHPPLEGH